MRDLKIVLYVIILFSIVSCINKQGTTERFVIIGDFHVGRDSNQLDIHENLVYQIKLLNPDYVFFIGDMIDGITYDTTILNEQWLTFDSLTKDIRNKYVIPGNHDIFDAKSKKIYTKINNELYWTLKTDKILFVGLNSTEDEKVNWTEQLQWLERNFKKARKQKIVLLSHYPLIEPEKFHHPIKFEPEFRAGLLNLIKTYNVKYVFSGHLHFLRKLKTELFTQYISGGGGINMVLPDSLGSGNHFLLCDYADDSINVNLIKYAGINPICKFPIENVDSIDFSFAQNTDKSGYKLYTNNTFKIKYYLPTNLLLLQEKENLPRLEMRYLLDDKKSSIFIFIDEWKHGAKIGMDDDMEFYSETLSSKGISLKPISEGKSLYREGFEAYEYLGESSDGRIIKNFYISKRNTIYCLILSSLKEHIDNNVQIFDEFCKSFVVLD